jgi:hypothetical protein
MPKPSSILSVYPPQALDNNIERDKPKYLFLYIDLKNCLVSLFVEEVITEIVTNTENMNNIDTSIFQSILYNVSWWKSYAANKGLILKTFIFTDVGRSQYHKSIYSEYKANREISQIHHSTHDEKLKEIRDKNFFIAEKILNQIPNIYFFCLKNLESDFVPYYLIDRKFKNIERVIHVMATSDHDHFQCLNLKNTYQICRVKSDRSLYDMSSVIHKYAVDKNKSKNKMEKLEKMKTMDPRWIVALQSISGDPGDNIPGIKGLGPMKATEMLTEEKIVSSILGTPEELENRIEKENKFFIDDALPLKSLSNNWQTAIIKNEIATRAYKLISFEQLCRWLEKQNTVEKINIIKYFDDVIYKKNIEKIPGPKSLMNALNTLEDNQLTYENINNLFS